MGNVFIAEPDGPVTSTTPSTRTTPVALGVDQFTRSTALPNAGAVAFVLMTVWCCTPAQAPGPGPRVKLSPSMPVPSCGPVVFVHGIPLTPAQVPGFASKLSHCASVFGELCRNTALVAVVFQAAVTFPDALVSKVQGVPETKSPSTTWFVESARNEMPAESTAKLESKLPFAANWPGRSHERFWAFQGRVALPLSRSTPCRSSPSTVPIVHVTVREASPFSVCVGRSPRTGGARNARRRLTDINAHRPIAPKRYARVGLVASMAIPPHCPLLPAQDPSLPPASQAKAQGPRP